MESPAAVIETIASGAGVFSVRFERPAGFSYLPGQFMFITIGGEPPLVHHLTISSSPTESFLQVTKKQTGSPFARALSELRKGDRVTLRGPYGKFTFTGEFPKVAFLAGGIGITPFRSMLRYAADEALMTDFTFLFSVRSESDIIFREDLWELADSNPHLSIVVTLTRPGEGWKGHTGRIDSTFIGSAIPDWKERVFYTCGPIPFVNAMRSLLTGMGVPENQVNAESFPGY